VIRKKKGSKEIVIDLTGPEGNAYYLLALADKYARQLNKDSETIQNDMKSGDYKHLLKVFDDNFGNFVILER
jgi:hypothetical protein